MYNRVILLKLSGITVSPCVVILALGDIIVSLVIVFSILVMSLNHMVMFLLPRVMQFQYLVI